MESMVCPPRSSLSKSRRGGERSRSNANAAGRVQIALCLRVDRETTYGKTVRKAAP